MKRFLSVMSLILTCALLFGIAAPCAVYAAEKPYEIRELTAYLYDLEHTAVYNCLFKEGLPDVPYMDAKDYLSNVYIAEFTEGENDDGTYTVSCKEGTMTVDPDKDTVRFDTYE